MGTHRRPQDPLVQWEETFEPGLVAASREAPEPWLAGHVHLVRDLPDQPEPVPTGGLPFHQVIVPLTPAHVTESVRGAKPYLDGPLRPGTVHVVSREMAEEDARTTWRAEDREGFGVVSLMLAPGQVAEAARAFGLDYAQTAFVPVTQQSDPLLGGVARALAGELDAGAPGGRLYAEQLMQAVAVHLVARYTARKPVAPIHAGGLPPQALRRVKEYVEAHFTGDIALADLAEQAAMSPYHFARLFKESTGQSPYEYVIERRLARARKLLRAGEYRIGEVAYALGYADPSHFTNQFKSRFGVTPSQFQRDVRYWAMSPGDRSEQSRKTAQK